MSFFGILAVILVILFIMTIPTVFFIIRFTRFPETTGTKIFFHDTNDTKGCAIASLINKKTVRGRELLTCFPLDKMNPQHFWVVVESNKIEPRAKGAWMRDNDALIVYPHTVEAWYSNMFSKLEDVNSKTAVIKAQRGAIDLAIAHLLNMNGGEISRQDMALAERFKELQIKASTKEDKTGRPGSYPSPRPQDTFT